jgi:CII-binding regulator of phage lambda lysogenization HflD
MFTSDVVNVVRNSIFRKAPPSVVYGYGKRSINLNKVIATFEKHIFLSQTDLTRTFKRYVSTSLSERKLILVTTDFFIACP